MEGRKIPGHERVEIAVRPAVGDAFEGQLCPGIGIDAIHFARLQHGGDGSPCPASANRTGEQGILPRCGLGPNGALDNVRVYLDAAVVEEQEQRRTLGFGVTDGFGELRLAGDARQFALPEIEQRLDDAGGFCLSRLSSSLGRSAAGFVFDGPQEFHLLDGRARDH